MTHYNVNNDIMIELIKIAWTFRKQHEKNAVSRNKL